MSDIFQSLWYTIYRSLIASIIRFRWHRLWVRENEFHTSLNMDTDVMRHLAMGASPLTQLLLGFTSIPEYLRDLTWRRAIAHERDLLGRRNTYSSFDRFISCLRDIRAVWRFYYPKKSPNALALKLLAQSQSFDQTSKTAWFWLDLRACRDICAMITGIMLLGLALLSSILGGTDAFIAAFTDWHLLAWFLLGGGAGAFFAVFILRYNHYAIGYRREFRYVCPLL